MSLLFKQFFAKEKKEEKPEDIKVKSDRGLDAIKAWATMRTGLSVPERKKKEILTQHPEAVRPYIISKTPEWTEFERGDVIYGKIEGDKLVVYTAKPGVNKWIPYGYLQPYEGYAVELGEVYVPRHLRMGPETIFKKITGKLENRETEFEVLQDQDIIKMFDKQKQVNILGLPAEYEYELSLSQYLNKNTTIVSYGTDWNAAKVFFNAEEISKFGSQIVSLVATKGQNIDDIIHNPEGVEFELVNGTDFGLENMRYPLPAEGFDIIDLDYLGIPYSTNMTRDEDIGTDISSFDYVNEAAKITKTGGIVCATFTLKSSMPYEHTLFNSLKVQRPSYYKDIMDRFKASGMDDKAFLSQEYKNQIVMRAKAKGIKLIPIHVNAYAGGARGTTAMWRGVFKKA